MAKKAKKDAPRSKSRAAAAPKEPMSIYSILMLMSALALFLACIFLFLEMKAYNMQIKVPGSASATGAWQVPGITAPSDVHLV